jgi:hypothetical protein
VKSPLEILLFSIHRGAAREVVALGLHDERPGLDYLGELRRSNPKGHQILIGQIRLLCDVPDLRTKATFKLLDPTRQLYEFKTRSGLRLYCFADGDALVILTNGGKKNTPREQNRDIEKARRLHDEFLTLKSQGAKPIIIDP